MFRNQSNERQEKKNQMKSRRNQGAGVFWSAVLVGALGAVVNGCTLAGGETPGQEALGEAASALCFPPGEVVDCYVNGVPGTRTCGEDAHYGPCSSAPPPPQTFQVTPKYKILTVIYAPPGTQGGGSTSAVTYGQGSTSGTVVSSSKSFKQSYSVSASGQAGFLGASGEVGGSFSYGRSTSNTQAVELRKATTMQITHRGPAVDGVDHNRDQIWLWLSPRLNVTTNGSEVTWTVDKSATMNIQYVYVAQLKDPSLMPPGLAAYLQGLEFTTEDYAEILKADPYAYGTPAIDPARYQTLNTTFPYLPPFAPGDPVPTFGFSATYSNTSTNTTSLSNEYTLGVKVAGAVDVPLFKAKLSVENKWTWTDTDTRSSSGGTSESAQVTVGGPSFGYAGPTNIAVYYDVLYKSFLFTPIVGSLRTLQGTVTSDSAEPLAGREVVLTGGDGTAQRTFTDANGDYLFFAPVSSPATVRSGAVSRALPEAAARAQRDDRVDLVVP
jgi:hypothetical protein